MAPLGGFESDWETSPHFHGNGWQLCGDVRFNSFKTPNNVGRHAHNTHACRSSETSKTCCILYWFRLFFFFLLVAHSHSLHAASHSQACKFAFVHPHNHRITYLLRWAAHDVSELDRIEFSSILLRCVVFIRSMSRLLGAACIANVSDAWTWTCYIFAIRSKTCELGLWTRLMSDDHGTPHQYSGIIFDYDFRINTYCVS